MCVSLLWLRIIKYLWRASGSGSEASSAVERWMVSRALRVAPFDIGHRSDASEIVIPTIEAYIVNYDRLSFKRSRYTGQRILDITARNHWRR